MSDTRSQIGPYRMEGEIGRGGMGVVYLARDTNLDRDVAIKTLPDELATDPDRLARFQREAKTLAALNHSNIATIYGLEEVEGKRYLILEYVPGDTLDAVLDRGPMPVSEALPVVKQIAEAIEAAHERGIIHRDLKPANIKFAEEDQVKVLDFGLAKAFEEHVAAPSADLADSPTEIPTNTPTLPGVVLGTAGYLSPEQARGGPVDKRSDIFSFGCVLYEMLAGKTTFRGETVADSLGATLHQEPNWDDLPPDTPPTILLLLRRCLTKDRRRRLHDIADARVEIEDAINDPTSSSLDLARIAVVDAGTTHARSNRVKVALAFFIGAVLTGTATLAVVRALEPEPSPEPMTRFSMTVPDTAQRWGAGVSISENGRTVIVGGGDGLLVRQMDRHEFVRHPVEFLTDHAVSPDGLSFAYRDGRSLHRASVGGGPTTRLCEGGFGFGMHWAPDGWIYVTRMEDRQIARVPETGGEPEILVTIELSEAKRQAPRDVLFSPHALPGGETILCTYHRDLMTDEDPEIRAYSISDGSFKTVLTDAAQPCYLHSGHLVFSRQETLMAAPFDPETLELTGAPVSIVEGVGAGSFVPVSRFALSASGTLLYLATSGSGAPMSVQAFGANEDPTPLVSFTHDSVERPRVSPDGRQIAVVTRDFDDRIASSIWLIDRARDIPALLTTEGGLVTEPVWSPDGEWLYYTHPVTTESGGARGIYRRRTDFSGDAELVIETNRSSRLYCFDATGTRLFGAERVDVEDGPNHTDIITVNLQSEPPVIEPWLATPYLEDEFALSPNGRWAAYLSTETGESELYVRAVDGTQKQRISTGGAMDEPFWSSSGDTLFYLVGTRETAAIHAVHVTSGHETAQDDAAPLETPFDWDPAGVVCNVPEDGRSVGLHPDGEGFIASAPVAEDAAQHESFDVQVVLNFHEELKRRVPVGD